MDIMVDIETTGTDPAHAAIIQIAAVPFNIVTKEVCADNMFDRCLIPAPGRFWDESTRQWWGKQPPHVLGGISSRMENPEQVIREFAAWIEGVNYGHVRLWAKPLSFEDPFLQSYFKQFDITYPFKYWKSMDLNSYIEGRGHDRSEFWETIEFEGDKHNALFDVLHQIKGALQA
jgi:3' exoribonuclease, RNase T-like